MTQEESTFCYCWWPMRIYTSKRQCKCQGTTCQHNVMPRNSLCQPWCEFSASSCGLINNSSVRASQCSWQVLGFNAMIGEIALPLHRYHRFYLSMLQIILHRQTCVNAWRIRGGAPQKRRLVTRNLWIWNDLWRRFKTHASRKPRPRVSYVN